MIWEWWQWGGAQHSLKLLHYWSLAIRLSNVISRTLVGKFLTLCWDAVVVFYSPADWAARDLCKKNLLKLMWRSCIEWKQKSRNVKLIATNSKKNGSLYVCVYNIYIYIYIYSEFHSSDLGVHVIHESVLNMNNYSIRKLKLIELIAEVPAQNICI